MYSVPFAVADPAWVLHFDVEQRVRKTFPLSFRPFDSVTIKVDKLIVECLVACGWGSLAFERHDCFAFEIYLSSLALPPPMLL